MGITCGKLYGYYLDKRRFIHRPVLKVQINPLFWDVNNQTYKNNLFCGQLSLRMIINT